MISLEYIEEVSLMFALLVVYAFCSAAETSYSAADKNILGIMIGEKRCGAKLAVKLLDDFDSALTAILTANTMVCIALSSVGAVVFGDMLKDDEYGAAVSGVLLTVLILIFGEITPKLLAKDAPEKVACFLSVPLFLLIRFMKPFCFLISLWKILLMKLFKLKQ